MPRSTLVTPDIEYPDSDGLPMAESFSFILTHLEENRARREAEDRLQEAEARLVELETGLQAMQPSSFSARPDQPQR